MKKNISYFLSLFILIFYSNLFATKIEILAKINNQIITNIDLENRLSLAIEISDIPNEIKFRKQIRQQMLNLLKTTLSLLASSGVECILSDTE